ncbi:hypothetical protein FEM48_Zijuj03G0157600 [Ziziphus jujuba var. spinosa]|uniref:Uncharacterized protein n=1 Tax=Ziziphus jujuba var. spinosa TaxID=714518 RepID=A0A978VR70_ZIZJJ|nr:hypothetical protein FEM48_Zijuj03G0157600 [Ziziphus jujuba var. spinosa]
MLLLAQVPGWPAIAFSPEGADHANQLQDKCSHKNFVGPSTIEDIRYYGHKLWLMSKPCYFWHKSQVGQPLLSPLKIKFASIVEEVKIVKRKQHLDEEGLPPLSARQLEILNNLKSLYFATPPCVKMLEENDASSYALVPLDIRKPETPMVDQSTNI